LEWNGFFIFKEFESMSDTQKQPGAPLQNKKGQYLFGADQFPPPSKNARPPRTPSHTEKRLSPVVVGGSRYTDPGARSIPFGQVRLDSMASYDWKQQLSDLLHAYGRQRSRKPEQKVSEETLRNRTDIVFSTIKAVMKDRKLKTLSQVRPRLLPRIFEIWNEKGIGKRAQWNYYSYMRWFWRIFAIEVGSIKNYEVEAGEFTINRNATTDRSWKGNGVDFDEVLKLMHELDPVAARILLAIKTFGLRLKEGLRLRPHEADGINKLNVTEGSKGGRPRQLLFDEFEDQQFREVLDELKGQVPQECHLAWSNRTLEQAKKRMYHLCRVIGLTRNGRFGVTVHGLRHDWAIDNLESLTGHEAPVRGGLVINYREISAARGTVTRAMGHYRLKVTGAYYGSYRSLEREQLRAFDRSWSRIEVVMREVCKLLQGNGVQNLYWVGARSLGEKGESFGYEFVLPAGIEDEVAWRLAPQVAELVSDASGKDCVVHPWRNVPTTKQALWAETGVPLFEAVGPMEYMQRRVKEQKAVRTKALAADKANKTQSDSTGPQSTSY
jgi:integrase